ncbi:MAG TPA: amylo-alpha-1,6-glucosidase [Phycisphaerae bacterium]|nr:amylo-alpha-1,6-glucosidase [Phycisphaerae bacterium]
MEVQAGPLAQTYAGLDLPGEDRVWALMAALPAAFLRGAARGGAGVNLGGAQRVLEVAAGMGDGLLPRRDGAASEDMDIGASLWFVHAAHAYAGAGGDEALVRDVLLPRSKRIVQAVIAGAGEAAGGTEAVRMDDGGMLGGVCGARGVRLNALWYAALETMAEGLHAAGDPAGDHFERLAGRFRRSFSKAYWCDDHGCVCAAGHNGDGHGALPLADQVVLSILAASPIPRTKQRQALLCVREKALGEIGVRMEQGDETVESVVHRVWLARALAATAENPGMGKVEEAEVMAGLAERVGRNVAATYRDGAPMGGGDLLATAEVWGARG